MQGEGDEMCLFEAGCVADCERLGRFLAYSQYPAMMREIEGTHLCHSRLQSVEYWVCSQRCAAM